MSGKPLTRVVFIGEAGVGKTSIIQRYVHGSAGSKSPTLGAEYSCVHVNLDGGELPLEIWDTAGAERYRSIGPIYYRKAAAAVAVFDLTSARTMQELAFWIESYRANSEQRFVVIVGNKSDAPDREVTLDESEDFASRYDASVIWTSAINGDRISDLFELLARHFVELTRPSEKPPAPDSIDVAKLEPQKRCC
jgi:small GTP-binding protein